MFALLVIIAAVTTASPPLGTFCIDGDCRRMERPPVRVNAAEVSRPFVWIAGDEKLAIVGTIGASETLVPDHTAYPKHEIALRLSDDRNTRVTLELAGPNGMWTFPVGVASQTKLTLIHPRCECTVNARAEEYRSTTNPIADAKEVSVLLRRLPAITGLVLDGETSVPMAGAEISIAGREGFVVTGENGSFRFVVDGDWPSAIRIEHPARAPKLVPVPKAVADVELSPVRLVRGGTIRLVVAPPMGGSEPMSWEIRKDDKDAALVRSGEMAVGVSEASIESLDPGLLRVLVKGTEPLQRYATKARVVAGKTTDVGIEISPLLVEGEVSFDEEPLASPKLEVRPRSGAWVANFTADDEGRFTEELWQPGEHNISVSREPLVRIWGTDRSLEGDGRMKLELKVPNRRIRGRVTDSRTGAPIGDVVVSLRARLGTNGVVLPRLRTAADGSFEFTGIEAGDVTLTAQKTGYRFTRPVTFVLGEDEGLHEENLLLEELAVKRTLVATDARGIPLVGAAVFAPGAGPDGFARVATTDGEGQATIHLRSAEDRGMLYVVPRSGSIGFAPLAAADAGGVIAVRVLDAASLNLKIESTDGEPIARVAVIMRINGTPIPPDIAAQMAYMQGLPLTSDASGQLAYPRLPPGQYELWPIASKRDPRDAAPVTVAVLPGPQTVVMKFRPK